MHQERCVTIRMNHMPCPADQERCASHNGRSESILGIVACIPAAGYQTTEQISPGISGQESVCLKAGAGQRTNLFHVVLTTHPITLQDRLELRHLWADCALTGDTQLCIPLTFYLNPNLVSGPQRWTWGGRVTRTLSFSFLQHGHTE